MYPKMNEQKKQDNAKQAAIAFSKILRHIGEKLEAVNENITDEAERDEMPYTILELSDAFLREGGFKFSKEQALSLAYTFEIVNQGCQNLTHMAQKAGHKDTALTFNWASMQAADMTMELEERHKNKQGGVIGFDSEMKTKLTQSIGGTAEWERQDFDPEEEINKKEGKANA